MFELMKWVYEENWTKILFYIYILYLLFFLIDRVVLIRKTLHISSCFFFSSWIRFFIEPTFQLHITCRKFFNTMILQLPFCMSACLTKIFLGALLDLFFSSSLKKLKYLLNGCRFHIIPYGMNTVFRSIIIQVFD